MSRQHIGVSLALLCLSILAVAVAVRYYGIGRWWSKASSTDIRSSILSRLNSLPPYRQFTSDLRRRALTSLAVDVWLPVQNRRAKTTAPPSESDDVDLSDDDLKKVVSRIAHGRGTIDDGHYRVTIIVRREYRVPLFQESVKLADCIGEATLTIHDGQIRACSIALRDLKQISDINERLIGILAALRDPILPIQYRGASLQLLDGRACDLRTARHIEQLYSSAAQWPNNITDRIVHLGFIASARELAIYYRQNHFSLTSADLLGVPRAVTLGERVCRVCVLATMKNAFGEAIDTEQSILALEQADAAEITAREVRRVAAVDFNADLINGLLTGRISNPLMGYILTAVLAAALAIIVRYVLAVCVQIKTLFTKTSINVTVVSGSDSNDADTSQGGTGTE